MYQTKLYPKFWVLLPSIPKHKSSWEEFDFSKMKKYTLD